MTATDVTRYWYRLLIIPHDRFSVSTGMQDATHQFIVSQFWYMLFAKIAS